MVGGIKRLWGISPVAGLLGSQARGRVKRTHLGTLGPSKLREPESALTQNIKSAGKLVGNNIGLQAP